MSKSARKFFTEEEKENIKLSIKNAELDTSGEIRVHVENKCKGEVLDRATYVFNKLKMDKTELRNGVLFYLAIKNRKFAILGDMGINEKVPDDFWDDIKDTMLTFFREDKFAEGLAEGVAMAGMQLKEHFPYQTDDVNELSDDISFGDN